MLSNRIETINLANMPLPSVTPKRTKLVLNPKDCFIFDIPLRRAPPKDLSRFVSLEIERLTPFKVSDIVFKYDLIKDESRQRIKVWVVMREHINHLLQNTTSIQIQIFSHDGQCLVKQGAKPFSTMMFFGVAISVLLLTLGWVEYQRSLLDEQQVTLAAELKALK